MAAAGRGTRLGASLPKAFVPLDGRSLVERSVRTLLRSGVIDEVRVLVSPEWESYARDLFAEARLLPDITLVHGGGERADSVYAGLRSLPHDGGPGARVLIHDAARALTPVSLIRRIVDALDAGERAVIPVLPVADTIKVVSEEDRVESTPARTHLRAVQTPQGFDLAALRDANEAYFSTPVEQRGQLITDDASLMEWRGVPVTCVPGDPLAMKITTPLDYEVAQLLLDRAQGEKEGEE